MGAADVFPDIVAVGFACSCCSSWLSLHAAAVCRLNCPIPCGSGMAKPCQCRWGRGGLVEGTGQVGRSLRILISTSLTTPSSTSSRVQQPWPFAQAHSQFRQTFRIAGDGQLQDTCLDPLAAMLVALPGQLVPAAQEGQTNTA